MLGRRLDRMMGVALWIGATGCGGDDAVPGDAGLDAWSDESSTDAGQDAQIEQQDAGTLDATVEIDAAHDAGTDATVDAADVCTGSRDVTAGGLFEAETTVGAGDDHGPRGSGCPTGGAASGSDVSYVLAPIAATEYRIVVTPAEGSSFDPMLYVLASCASESCIDGTRLNGPGESETLDVSVGAGARVFLVVDGQLGSSGAYTLEVTIPE